MTSPSASAEEDARILSSQLERARRMEAVGNLAAGVAHDLNNMPASIVGYPEMMLLDLPAESPLGPPLEAMRQSGRKAAAIVQDLLTIARLEAPVHGLESVPPGEYVHLQLEDEGVGIAESGLKRIFEPFFTKKRMGHSGTGLGMTVIWATVKDHHGYIDVTRREGTGTRFGIYFPANCEPLVVRPRPVALEDYLGCERLLVVDDMADQRTITASMLRKLGYQVETASSGEEAIGLAVRQELARVCKDRPVENGLGLSCAGGQRPALPEGRQFPTDDVI